MFDCRLLTCQQLLYYRAVCSCVSSTPIFLVYSFSLFLLPLGTSLSLFFRFLLNCLAISTFYYSRLAARFTSFILVFLFLCALSPRFQTSFCSLLLLHAVYSPQTLKALDCRQASACLQGHFITTLSLSRISCGVKGRIFPLSLYLLPPILFLSSFLHSSFLPISFCLHQSRLLI